VTVQQLARQRDDLLADLLLLIESIAVPDPPWPRSVIMTSGEELAVGYRERRTKRREWLAREREALERGRAERWARNEPRRQQWRATWHNVRLALRIMLVLMTLAVCGAIAF
jgi:hypothetical protein